MPNVVFEPRVNECLTLDDSGRQNVLVEYDIQSGSPEITVSVPKDSGRTSAAAVRNIIGEMVLGRTDCVAGHVPASPDEQLANAVTDAALRIQWLLRVHLPDQTVKLRKGRGMMSHLR